MRPGSPVSPLLALALAVAAALLVLVVACRTSPAQVVLGPVPEGLGVFVSPEDAEALRAGGATLLDTRDPLPYRRAHAPGAVRVAWRDFSDPEQAGRLHPDAAELQRRIEATGVSRDRPVVVMGAWRDGWGEEGRLYWMLESLGHPEVSIVYGGAAAWLAAGLPATQDVPEPAPGAFPLEPRPEASASLASFASAPDAPPQSPEDVDPTVVLDVRTRAEFEGATPYGSVRGGHVPGAEHLEWTDLFDEHGALRSRAELEALLPPPGVRVVAYCTGGVRSGFVYAVLRALGREDVANYPGSWWEYAASDLPVE